MLLAYLVLLLIPVSLNFLITFGNFLGLKTLKPFLAADETMKSFVQILVWIALCALITLLLGIGGFEKLHPWTLLIFGLASVVWAVKNQSSGILIVAVLLSYYVFELIKNIVTKTWPDLSWHDWRVAVETMLYFSGALSVYTFSRSFKDELPSKTLYLILVFYGISMMFILLFDLTDGGIFSKVRIDSSTFLGLSIANASVEAHILNLLSVLVFLSCWFLKRGAILKSEVVFLILLYALFFLIFYFRLESKVWVVLINLAHLALSVGTVYLGVVTREKFILNLGFGLVFLFVLIKFFDEGYKFIDKSLFAFFAGIFFILFGLMLARVRGYLLRYLELKSD